MHYNCPFFPSPSEIDLLSLSGHSFFPGFHPIVLKEKGLVAHPQPAGWLHSVLIAWDSKKGGGVEARDSVLLTGGVKL